MKFRNMYRKYFDVAASADGLGESAGSGAPSEGIGDVVESTNTVQELKGDVKPEGKEEEPKEVKEGDGDKYPEGSVAEYATNFEDEPAMAMALEFLGEHGIMQDDPAFLAIDTGDFTMLEAILATKGVAGADRMIEIMRQSYNAYTDAKQAEEAKTEAAVNSIFGEDTDAIVDYVRTNSTDEEREVFNSMLDAGGMYAIIAAHAVKSLYTGSLDTIPAKAATSTPTQTSSSQSVRMTRQEFARQVEALSKEMGGRDPRTSPKYAELARRRQAARAME